MHLCFFEDSHASNFLPLTYFRPVYDLKCGMMSLRERSMRRLAPTSVSLFVRPYLAPLLQEENLGKEINRVRAKSCLFVNGRTIMTGPLARELRKAKEDCVVMFHDQIVAVRLSGTNMERSMASGIPDVIDLSHIIGVPTVQVEAQLVGYPWDLVYSNETELVNDFALAAKTKARGKGQVHKAASLVNRKYIHIGAGSVVGPGAVLDATDGPIYLGKNVRIFPTAVIEGPAYVGDGTLIKAGAKIYGNTSIGPFCKVGGEVEHSIIHSHANKQHDGFLGHSYISPWVNLGAGTTTSNLKNTYGSVKVHINGNLTDSGKMFVGLTAGDHVKIGINGTIDTGTVIGPFSNLYGAVIPPKYVPPFSWGTGGSLSTYDVERATTVAATVMARRNVATSEAYKQLLNYIFTLTANERINY